ncbi:MAG: DUF6502 family protein, partial [Gammaproteobacteria bacterium]
MSLPESNVLKLALIATIRPIAAMLLKFGVGYKEFAEAAKIAFVAVASEDFGMQGRPTNVSRVALMTGLSRKDVRALRERGEVSDQVKARLTHLPAQVLRMWFTDQRYCDDSGVAATLTWDEGEVSFSDLVRNCGSNLSPVAMREELLRVGAIKQDSSGMLVPLRRYFIADSARDRLTEGIQFGLRPLALTLAKNVSTDGIRGLRFQRVVDSYSVPLERRAALEAEVTVRLRQFSEEIDDLLSEIGERSSPENGSAVG